MADLLHPFATRTMEQKQDAKTGVIHGDCSSQNYLSI